MDLGHAIFVWISRTGKWSALCILASNDIYLHALMSCLEIRKPYVITTHAPGGKLRLVGGGDARNALICISVSAQLLLVIKVAASPKINIPENNSVLS